MRTTGSHFFPGRRLLQMHQAAQCREAAHLEDFPPTDARAELLKADRALSDELGVIDAIPVLLEIQLRLDGWNRDERGFGHCTVCTSSVSLGHVAPALPHRINRCPFSYAMPEIASSSIS